jgi:hypothetical protein
MIHGNAETMDILEMGIFWHGKFKGWEESNLNKLKNRIRDWARWANN